MIKCIDLPLIKTQSHKNIKYLLDGKLYCNKLSYYRNKENNEKDTVVGDKYEALIPLKNAYIYFQDTNECCIVKDDHLSTIYSDDYVFCMSTINTCEVNSVQGNTLVSPEIEELGEESLIITDCSYFIDLVKNSAKKCGFEVRCGLVNYYDEEYDNPYMFSDLMKDTSNIAFWKRNSYRKQQEFRFLFHGNACENAVLELPLETDLRKIAYVLPSSQAKKLMIIKGNDLS